jgi:polyisoprenoid-binding protein YceI
MKKSGILVLAMALITMSFVIPTKTIEDNYTVDVASSTLNWKGYKPTGSHTGTIMLKSGNLIMEGNELKSGSFVANMVSIKDSEGSARLEGHLKSEDFFDVKVFATSKFEIIQVDKKDGKTYVTGNLTIKNITKEITFEATVEVKNNTVKLTSKTFKINRAAFKVTYKSKSFYNDLKDKFIEDEFDLQVTIVAKK